MVVSKGKEKKKNVQSPDETQSPLESIEKHVVEDTYSSTEEVPDNLGNESNEDEDSKEDSEEDQGEEEREMSQ